LGRSEGKW